MKRKGSYGRTITMPTDAEVAAYMADTPRRRKDTAQTEPRRNGHWCRRCHGPTSDGTDICGEC